MSAAAHPNVQRLATVARSFDRLLPRVVFLGGSVVDLLVTDPGAPHVRPTRDVDVVVELASLGAYEAFAAELRGLGFVEDASPGAPIGRWIVRGEKVDVMPSVPGVLTDGNRWYPGAMTSAVEHDLGDGLRVRIISAPFFVGTKLVAFASRGEEDYLASPDLEDVISIVAGRPELEAEVAEAPKDLRTFLAAEFTRMLGSRAFRDAVPCHLAPDETAQARLPEVLGLIERLGRSPAI